MKKVTINTLKKMKQAGERITMLTAYDASFARLLDRAGVEVLLVGDSLGMVIQGHDTTLPVTMDQMVYHCACVARGVERAHLVGDLSFGAYQGSADEAVKNAVRLCAEGGCEAVKLEGGAEYAEVVQRIVRAGIPVMGHIGLTPQSVHKMGGYVVQGRGEDKAARLIADARALEEADEQAEAELRKALAGTPSAEVRQRCDHLLGRLKPDAPSPERLRQERAMELLEGVATPEAKRLLEELAKGAPQARITAEAKAALGRLAR